MNNSDLRQLRNAFGTFLTGVTVVTSKEASGIPRGFTANSFTSVSLNPPMLLICVDKTAESFDVFSQAPGFAISILTEDQVDISGLFASKRPDKFEISKWVASDNGYPILEGACAWFDCAQDRVIDAGDHIIILGNILSFDYNNSIGLGYVRGGYMSLGMERSAANTAGSDSDVIVGAIIEHDGKLLLFKNSITNELYVPASGLNGSSGSLNKLQSQLDELDLDVTLSSLYSVFENESTGKQSIYYRAKTKANFGDDHFWKFSDIPWERVKSQAVCEMLQRYISESARQRFGVYFGSDRGGSVKIVSS